MQVSSKFGIFVLMVLLLSVYPLLACGGDDDEAATPPPSTAIPIIEPTGNPTPAEDVSISLGIVSDLTGLGATAMSVLNAAFNDVVRYFNEENRIPGAELKVLIYDGNYDPSKDIPGYQWLRSRGAEVIFGFMPYTPVTLKPVVDKDHIVTFSASCPEEGYYPPGYVFHLNASTDEVIWTFLKWVAENHWDYQTEGPAKIGCADWNYPAAEATQTAAKQYSDAHPDQFEWIGGYLTNFIPTWSTEVDRLKDADYVIIPAAGYGMPGFIKEFRNAGGTAQFLGGDAHLADLGITMDTVGPEGLDGMLFISPTRWYNEDFEIPRLANWALNEYHSKGEAAEFKKEGAAYIGAFQMIYGAISAIAEAINSVGPANFTSQVLYDSLQSFTITYDGGEPWGFSPTDRTSWDHVGLYEYSAAQQDVVRKFEDWLLLVTTP